jgi:hypothetical protein
LALVVACLVVLAFMVACYALRIVPVARRLLVVAGQSIATMRDPTLDDDTKERAARQAAVALFRAFLSITLRSLIAVLASATVIYAADLSGLVPATVAIDLLESWEFIIATTVALTAAYFVLARRFPSESQRFR